MAGSLVGDGDASAGTTTLDLPIGVAIPDVSVDIGVPPIPLPTPCGYGIATIPGAGFPVRVSLGAIAAALGLPIPFLEFPPVCPELQEVALIAAVALVRKAK